jgi:hypothetical protein
MLILIDSRLPREAKEKLSALGELLEFKTEGIVYEAVSGHPDIFFCETPSGLVAAPGMPAEYLSRLREAKIPVIRGRTTLGSSYPFTSHYNALLTGSYLVHNTDYTDEAIRATCPGIHLIHVKQSYSRCSLVHLAGDRFITSDRGILKALAAQGLTVLYVSPESILLPGFRHGFFGGSCGVHEGVLYLAGSLKFHPQGGEIRSFVEDSGLLTAELYEGPFFDGGGILFAG